MLAIPAFLNQAMGEKIKMAAKLNPKQGITMKLVGKACGITIS